MRMDDFGNKIEDHKRFAQASHTQLEKRYFADTIPTDIDTGRAIVKQSDEYIRAAWRSILLQYTKLKLSFETDRLMAINGIIQDIQARKGWKNICGLWEPFMLEELLWKFSDKKLKPRIDKGEPTWSWGSVQNGIWYDPLPTYRRVFHATFEGIEVILKADSMDPQQSQIGIRVESIIFELREYSSLRYKRFGIVGGPPGYTCSYYPNSTLFTRDIDDIGPGSFFYTTVRVP
jgi:hypothetical protein